MTPIHAGITNLVYKSDGDNLLEIPKRRTVTKRREHYRDSDIAPLVEVVFEKSGEGESRGNAHAEPGIWEVPS